jgi:hypothetical protein
MAVFSAGFFLTGNSIDPGRPILLTATMLTP